MEMKTLTVNGVTYTVSDPDSVAYTAQDLTDRQKAQARANIGAAGEESLGDMEAALDAILSIQNNLIGGDEV